MKFKIGDKVYKPKGYKFPGIVVSIFQTTASETRIVAELEDNGMLHIFSESQLEINESISTEPNPYQTENNKTPIQNVIDKIDKDSRGRGVSTEGKIIFNMVTSYLWDELENERKVMSGIFDSSKKENRDVLGKMWINKHFIDYQKIL